MISGVHNFKENQAKRLEQDERRKEAIEQERKRKEAEKARKKEIELEEVRKLREEKAARQVNILLFRGTFVKSSSIFYLIILILFSCQAAMNRTYDTGAEAGGSDLNSTYVKPGDGDTTRTMMSDKPVGNPDCYEITPARHELPPEPNVNPDNYDIEDLRSDEDTDDDDNPRKQVPKWAEGERPDFYF